MLDEENFPFVIVLYGKKFIDDHKLLDVVSQFFDNVTIEYIKEIKNGKKLLCFYDKQIALECTQQLKDKGIGAKCYHNANYEKYNAPKIQRFKDKNRTFENLFKQLVSEEVNTKEDEENE